MFDAVHLPQFAWMLIAAVIGFAVLGFLHAMANSVRNEAELHLLRVQVNRLRSSRIREIRRLHGLDGGIGGDDVINVDILDDGDGHPEPVQRQAA